MHCQIFSYFGRHVGVLERDRKMTAAYVSLENIILSCTDPYLCCEIHSCSKMSLNCVVFPTEQA